MAGELTGRDRPPDVEGLLTAQLAEDLGPTGDGVLEVEVDVEVPVVLGFPVAFFCGCGSNRARASSTSRSTWAQVIPWAKGEVPVHESGGVRRQHAGGVGDPERLPHRHPILQHPCPGLRQPVGELDHLADVGAPGVQGPAEERGELHDREVTDQRRTGAGDRKPRVRATFGQRRRVTGLLVHDMLAGPLRDRTDGGDLPLGNDGAVLADLGQQLLRPRPVGRVAERCGSEIHDAYSTAANRHHHAPRTRLWTGDPLARDLCTTSGPCAVVSTLGAGAPRATTTAAG
ncbi:hypothetical protein [Nocardioides antri]|uniref:Uncharacterized protein n=1 Tax=Nocardioides antri TaxID=2607659 RepID=A0A5B1M6Z2_9ACTN|nr:hypothetical protein [Nocardioides antri]KAA1427607.1 hypothetical protein F0U47_09160 [Nocardioides antri]